jgi:hypothetical protein
VSHVLRQAVQEAEGCVSVSVGSHEVVLARAVFEGYIRGLTFRENELQAASVVVVREAEVVCEVIRQYADSTYGEVAGCKRYCSTCAIVRVCAGGTAHAEVYARLGMIRRAAREAHVRVKELRHQYGEVCAALKRITRGKPLYPAWPWKAALEALDWARDGSGAWPRETT